MLTHCLYGVGKFLIGSACVDACNKTQQATFYNISISYDNLSAYDFAIANDTVVLIRAAEQLEYPLTVTSSIKSNRESSSISGHDELTFLITEVNSAGEVDNRKPLNQVTQASRFFRP